jgi:SpoVK/Ycf46/Vps4 family AAA+-type ATPase
MSLRERLVRVGEFVKKHEKSAKVAFETFRLLKDVAEKPSIVTVGQLFFGVLSAYAENNRENWSSDIFGVGWKAPCHRSLFTAMYHTLAGHPKVSMAVPGLEKNASISVYKVNGIEVGTIRVLDKINGIYVRDEQCEKATKILTELFRKTYTGNLLLIEQEASWREFWFDIKADNEEDVFHTSRTVEYAQELKSYFDAGINRSVMVYGPPGTGKSTFVRSVIEWLGLRSIRIRPDEMSGLHQNIVYEVIELMQPDAVVIDDFDRIRDQTALLEILQYLNRRVKLVMVTVNKRSGFDVALKRPQRFDLMKEVLTLEPETVKKVLGEESKDYFEQVKDWPVSYVLEFSRRRTVNKSPAAAKTWIAELQSRQKADPEEPEKKDEPPKGKKTNKSTKKSRKR